MRRLFTSAATAIVLGFGLHPAPVSAQSEVIDRILFLVDDTVVTQSDVMRLLPIYTEIFGVPRNITSSREGCDALVNDVQQFLVQATLLMRDSQRRELQVRDDEIEDFIAQRWQLTVNDRDAFVAELEAAGISYEDFEDFIRLNITRMRMIQLDVGARILISEAEIDREVALRYPNGLTETLIDTSHIFVQVPGGDPTALAEAEARMAERAARLAGGESLESVAADNEDATAARGGRIGQFSTLDLDQEYARAALGLEEGELSEPVRTSFGLHIIRLEGVERAPVDDASEIRDRVHFDLQQAAAEREEGVYLERVVAEAFVESRVSGTDWFCDNLVP